MRIWLMEVVNTPEQGYDCEGNINVQVGDEAFGGIVFYVDETGERGLVAADGRFRRHL